VLLKAPDGPDETVSAAVSARADRFAGWKLEEQRPLGPARCLPEAMACWRRRVSQRMECGDHLAALCPVGPWRPCLDASRPHRRWHQTPQWRQTTELAHPIRDPNILLLTRRSSPASTRLRSSAAAEALLKHNLDWLERLHSFSFAHPTTDPAGWARSAAVINRRHDRRPAVAFGLHPRPGHGDHPP